MHGLALLFRQQPSLSLPFQYQKSHYLKTFFARAGQTESISSISQAQSTAKGD